MAQATTERVTPRPARRPLPDLIVDRVWRFFCSVRAAIWEIAALAVLVLIGTLRGSSVPNQLQELVPPLAPVVDRWYAWDVFHSLLFMANLALLAVAIAIGGMINRAPGIWAAIANPTIATTNGFLRNAETSARVAVSTAPADLVDHLSAALRANRYRVLTEERGGEVHLYADRFRYAKLGTFPFHFALILVLVGGIVGARYGFRETAFMLPEGTVKAVGHDTGLSVRLDDFDETYLENGIAQEYRSTVTVLRDGDEVETAAITVNNPLTVAGTVFYQAGIGQAVDLRIADAQGRVLFDEPLPLGEYQAQNNPDAPAAVLELPAAGAVLHVIAPDTNPFNAPAPNDPGLWSGQLFLQLRPLGPDSRVVAPVDTVAALGQPASLGGLTVDFERERRMTVLQVVRNPGIPIFVVAALLLVGGLAVTFYFPHRRVRGIVAAGSDGGSHAALAPLARRDWSGQRAFERLVDDIEQRLQLPITRQARPSTTDPPTALPPGSSPAAERTSSD